MSVNRVMLIGRLGQDPDVKNTPSGKSVANFSLATSEKWKDQNSGQMHEKVEWHRCVAWNKTADLIAKYTHKGSQVFVEGRLETRTWDDKNGEKRYTTEVIVNSVQFLDSKGNGEKSTQQSDPSPKGHQETFSGIDPDDMPF